MNIWCDAYGRNANNDIVYTKESIGQRLKIFYNKITKNFSMKLMTCKIIKNTRLNGTGYSSIKDVDTIISIEEKGEESYEKLMRYYVEGHISSRCYIKEDYLSKELHEKMDTDSFMKVTNEIVFDIKKNDSNVIKLHSACYK